MTRKNSNGGPKTPHIPNPNRLINRPGSQQTLIILIPITGKDLMLVPGYDHGGARLPDVPDPNGAIPGRRGEDVGVAGVPGGGVNAVGVLLEGADTGGAIDGPELDGVVP